MASELISVIIPIYNTKQYLNRCISSVVNQTYKHLEIILIDDGSTDGSGELCDHWAVKDNRIRVIHKENAGQGIARNIGIDHATGSYIYFLDSDDYIDLHALELAYSQLKKDHSEVVFFGFSNINSKDEITQTIIPACKQTIFSGEEVQKLFLPHLLPSKHPGEDCWNLNASVCFALFSADLIRRTNWRFVSEREIISEDTYSLMILFKDIKQISVICKSLYCYRENDLSFSRAYRKDRFEKIAHFYRVCLDLCSDFDYSNAVKISVSSLSFGFIIAAMKQLVHSNETLAVQLAEIKRCICHDIWHDELLKTAISQENLQRKILFWCFLHHLTLPCYLLCKIKK